MRSVAEIFGIETISADLYRQALTHPSYSKEKGLPYTECYERLEFLGDAVLKLTISDLLYNLFETNEGEMSKIRAILVSDNTLAEICQNCGLADLIIMNKSEEKHGGRKLNSICACAFEAILGAYYLDGKYEQIKTYIKSTFSPYISEISNNLAKYNSKEILQEYTQSLTKDRPTYNVINESGPEHKKEFEVEVSYQGKILAVAKGHSKKDAEQKAAYSACEKLNLIK